MYARFHNLTIKITDLIVNNSIIKKYEMMIKIKELEILSHVSLMIKHDKHLS